MAMALAGALTAQARVALACGCFAPPSPMTPVVQAGERIVFAHDGTNVTAYIQIQYQGAAADFGWLVPLPSVPTLEIGTDELFTVLEGQTNPQYSITRTTEFCNGGQVSSSGAGCSGPFGASAEDRGSVEADGGFAAALDLGLVDNSALVVKASIGPYDYAVLKADDQSAMQQWLVDNRYYVPDATGAAVAPYIHPGGFFLALKLRAGESAGDVTPIVLRYASDLPMIPITLTQVGAIPDMGVLVWSLGDARAIPRNYYQVEIDEMPIWENLLSYPQQAILAVHSAPNRHGFLTEYAGTSAVMSGKLFFPGRFGNPDDLRVIQDPSGYLDYLRAQQFTFSGQLFAILERYIPLPPKLAAQGVSESQFYMNLDYWLQQAMIGSGDPDAGTGVAFDPAALTDELWMRIVQPAKAGQQLFDQNPYLTRLYTALSPEDMNLDPVFSENPDLPGVPSQHNATLTTPCMGEPWLHTDTGLEEQWVSGLPPNKTWPAAARVEMVREAGLPDLVTDNTALIATTLGPVDHGTASHAVGPTDNSSDHGCSCDLHRQRRGGALGTFLIVCAAIVLARRRARRTV
jgi:hypothetical protein